MSTPNPNRERRLLEHAERNLGALVVTVEFTLISVMVGVILAVLVASAAPLIRDLQFEYWLYILSGLLLILYLWAEVISHTLSFVGWPLEFGHNLFYIVFTLTLAIQMNFVGDPVGWFAMSAVSSTVATVVFFYDRRVIERRLVGARGAAANLFNLALSRQRGLISVSPLNILNGVVMLGLVVAFRALFIEQHFHLILVAIQIAAVLFFLRRTIRSFMSWTEPIALKAVEELEAEGER